jgi:hypothetical protein
MKSLTQKRDIIKSMHDLYHVSFALPNSNFILPQFSNSK